MVAFLATIAVYGMVWAIQKVYAQAHHVRPPAPPKAGPQKFTVQSGMPIPMFWGRTTISAPNVVWASKPVFVSHDPTDCPTWAQSLVFILGVPGAGRGTGGDVCRLSGMWINGERVQPGLGATLERFPDGTELFLPFFFGAKGEGGSIDGRVFFENGLQDNTFLGFDTFINDDPRWRDANDKVSRLEKELRDAIHAFTFNGGTAEQAARVIGAALALGAAEDALPGIYDEISKTWGAFRGQAKVFLGPAQVSQGFAYGESFALPQFAFEVIAPCNIDFGGGIPKIFSMLSGDANPVAIIYDVLTGDFGRLGISDTFVDKDNFSEVGQTLTEEDHGCSLYISEQSTGAEIIKTVLTQIDGIMYVEPTTSQYTLKLIRNDYGNVGSLPLLNPANVIELMDYSTSTFTGGYNVVHVTYTNRTGDLDAEAVALELDMGSLNSQGLRRSYASHFPGVRTPKVAAAVAARTLQELASPLATLRLKCLRQPAADFRPGTPFRFSWPDYGITDEVYRVQQIDLGSPDDDGITIDAVRDKFDVAGPLMRIDDPMPLPAQILQPLETRKVTEAPRYLLYSAQAEGLVGDPAVPRGLYLAVPSQPNSEGYSAQVSDPDGVLLRSDMPTLSYLATGRLTLAYSRNNDPYDTTVGVFFQFNAPSSSDNLHGGLPSDIRARGKALVMIDDEILAFEDWAIVGDDHKLVNVWRGLADTVPADHAEGAVVYFLSNETECIAGRLCGRIVDYSRFNTGRLEARLLPVVNGRSMPNTAAGVEADLFDPPRSRAYLPYPVADFKVNGQKTFQLLDEGVVTTWVRRSNRNRNIERGDEADYSPSGGDFRYHTFVRRKPKNLPETTARDLDTATTTTSTTTLNTSIAGHGAVVVGNFTRDLSLGTPPAGDSFLSVENVLDAPNYRNLIVNGNFSDGMTGWTILAGDPISATTLALGGTIPYVSPADPTDSPDIALRQTIELADWLPQEGMLALLTFYTLRAATDADSLFDDEITVTLTAQDGAGATLGTQTDTIVPTYYWQRNLIAFASLPVGTVKLQLDLELTAVDEPPSSPSVHATEFRLIVGDIWPSELTNSGFDSSISTGWTAATGSFTQELAAVALSNQTMARGGTSATNEIYQDVSIGTAISGEGYTTAVLRWWQANDTSDTGDKGQVIIEARTSGGTVLTSTSTTAEQITPEDQWVRRHLILPLPLGTEVVRTRLLATRTAGSGTCNACFDDVDLMFHRELDPQERQDVLCGSPLGQRLPLDPTEWMEAFPYVPLPDYGFFSASTATNLSGFLGIEPEMVSTSTVQIGKFIGCMDPERLTFSKPAWDFKPTDTGILATADHFKFGNFANGEPFTALVHFRKRTRSNEASGICGRRSDTAGWSIGIDSSGRVQAILKGQSGTATATRSTSVSDGAPHFAALVYDGTNLVIYDDYGNTSVSATGVGDIQPAEQVPFCIGKGLNGILTSETCLDGQIRSVWVWRTTLASDQIASLWTHGGKPGGTMTLSSYSRTGAGTTFLGTDTEGEIHGSWGAAQIPLATINDGATVGYASAVAVTNLAPASDFEVTANWTRETGPVYTDRQGPSPTGFFDAIQIAGDNTAGMRCSATVGSGTVTAFWFARVPSGGSVTARVAIENSSGVNKGNYDYTVTNQWLLQRKDFTGWDASTASCRLRFLGSSSGTAHTIQVAGPVLVLQGAIEDYVMRPYGASIGDGTLTLVPDTLPYQHNFVGSIYLECRGYEVTMPTRTMLTLHNNVDDKDKKIITSLPRFAHYDDTGTAVNSDPADPSNWLAINTFDARWNQGSLLEDVRSAKFAGMRVTNVAGTYGRTAIWDPTTTPLTRLILNPSNQLILRVVLLARELLVGQVP